MQIKVKRVDTSLPLPEYKTNGSVAFDLYSRVDMIIKPKTIELVPLNLIVETREDFFLLIAVRSSTPLKKGIMAANSVGIIDQDYCGPLDELKLAAYNFTDEPVMISRGERLAQGLLVKFVKAELTEGEINAENSRSGFGSTGQNV